MSLTGEQKSFLRGTFGERVTFDRTERRLYGHDIGALPHLVRPLIRNSTPDAVVQPETESELVDLVRWARDRDIPLTPRAKASSGYGGVIPVKGGVVVDFYRLRAVEAIDASELTARVQPGITWDNLDRALSRQGLTLRLYPSSYPSWTWRG